ncbi:MAG: hypothetical protein IJ020_04920 [Bacteroidaceae bacterium]|nr:hypothetical protein [Bacteroidaceae bacterium]
MKKLHLFLLAMCAFMFACTNEQESVSPETVEVSFCLDVENLPVTRAISDGTGATQLMYGVFNEAGELIISKNVVNNVTALLTQEGYKMSVSLTKGQSYKAVFWAQNPNCEAYTVSDDMQLTVNYEGINNDEARDAFYAATEIFKVEGTRTIGVVLKRPFAQVNVGAFPFDFEHAAEQGVDIATSSANIQNVPNQLNMFTGEATGEVEVNYSLNTIPEEELVVDVDNNGVTESYVYLSMSYLLASPTSSTHAMSFVFAEADGSNPIDFNTGLESVPVCRNWRTNIVGQFLTGDISFNVKIDPIYEGETINSAGLYYNFSEDILIEDKVFAFNTDEAATFTSQNNNLLTFNDVTFSGRVQFIAFGEYRDKGNYINFTNVLNRVVAKDMVVDHPGIENVKAIDYMCPLVFLRGVNTVNDCEFTGTTTTAVPFPDNYGDMREPLPYDCGVPNNCAAVFNNCVVDRLYAWSHSMITLNDTKLKYIRCSTHHNSFADAHLTVGPGTVVDEIFVTSSGLAKRAKDENGQYHWIDDPANRWAPSIIVKAGAVVKRLDMNNRPSLDKYGNLSVIIEEGATVGEIVNAIDEIPNPAPSI